VETYRDITSARVTSNGMFYVTSFGTSNYNIVTFNGINQRTTQATDIISKIRSKNIQGDLEASRCTLSQGAAKLYCLVKKNTSPSYATLSIDEIIMLDIQTGNLETPYQGITLSGRALYYSRDNKLYYISASQNVIYELK
jgi:hypothetical protein